MATKVRKGEMGKEPGHTGIRIECRGAWGWRITRKQPYCIINGVDNVGLEWERQVLVPLQPNVEHRIGIAFPYLGAPCKPAAVSVNLTEGEVQEYLYSIPNSLVVLGEGKIERTR